MAIAIGQTVRRAVNAATRTARRAAVVARRRPALALAVLLGVLALVWLLKRSREGWEFEGKKKLSATSKHGKAVTKYCGGGMTLTEIMANDDYGHLSKYTKDSVWAVCEAAQKDLKATFDKNEVDTSKCKNGACTNTLLARGGRPCLNKAGKKCCKPGGKDCIAPEKATTRDTEISEKECKTNKHMVGSWSDGKCTCPWPTVWNDRNKACMCNEAAGYSWVASQQRCKCGEGKTAGKWYVSDGKCLKGASSSDPVAWNQTSAGDGGNAKVTLKSSSGASWSYGPGPYNRIGNNMEDKISTVVVPAGLTVRLHEHANLGGAYLDLQQPGTYDLSNFKFVSEANGEFKGSNQCKNHYSGSRGNVATGGTYGCWKDIASSLQVYKV